MKDISRRDMMKMAGLAAGSTLGIAAKAAAIKTATKADSIKIKLVAVGGHPGDPEVCCGGTMSLFAAKGHEVVCAYLNRGEAGVAGKSKEEAGKIRTAEAQAACAIMKCRPAFLSQADGESEINSVRYEEIYAFLKKESPSLVMTHWPIDSHRDHRNCSLLVYDAWLKLGKSFDLYYFEVELGKETQNFMPTDYVDINTVRNQKHKASNCHVSQGIPEVFQHSHDLMERLRGMESNYPYAEAFVRHMQNPSNALANLINAPQ
jgi:LmbE family N-acetylglucosaminyl deacetylase